MINFTSQLKRFHPLAKGLVFDWNGGAGNTGNVARDMSHNKINGTFVNDVAWDGDALAFDGANDYVNFGTPPELDLVNATRNELTAAIWIYPTAAALDYQISVGHDDSGSFRDNQWFLGVFTGPNMVAGVGDGITQNNVTTPSGSITLNAWNHVVFTINEAKLMRIYINGILQAGEATYTVDPVYTAQKDFAFGKNSGASINGKMRQALVYDRALNANEIAQLYANPTAMYETDSPYAFVAGAPPVGSPPRHPLLGPLNIPLRGVA